MTKHEYLGYIWAPLDATTVDSKGHTCTYCQIWCPDGRQLFDSGGWGFATGVDINGTVYNTLQERVEAAIRARVVHEVQT